jgi:hypothetical protein
MIVAFITVLLRAGRPLRRFLSRFDKPPLILLTRLAAKNVRRNAHGAKGSARCCI